MLNYLPANAAPAADHGVALALVNFLLHASPPHGATELSADHLLPDGATAYAAALTLPWMSGAGRRGDVEEQGDTSQPLAEFEGEHEQRAVEG